jgi:hypothetical protein
MVHGLVFPKWKAPRENILCNNLLLANQINGFKLCQQIGSAPPSSTFRRGAA